MSTIPIRQCDRTSRPAVKLLSAAPLHQLLTQLRSDHATMVRFVPHGDAAETLRVIVAELSAAIERASDISIFMTIEELSETTGKPESTLTRLCREHGAEIGAAKIAGSWSIHWPTFETYCRGSDKPLTEEAA